MHGLQAPSIPASSLTYYWHFFHPAHQIRADILAHEAKRPELPGPSGLAIGGREDLVGLETAHYSSSSSSEDESMQQVKVQLNDSLFPDSINFCAGS